MNDRLSNPSLLYDKDVSRTYAEEIAKLFFGGQFAMLEVLRSAYLFECGRIRLRICRTITVPGFVHCGVEILNQRVGYFNFDINSLRMSPLWKDD